MCSNIFFCIAAITAGLFLTILVDIKFKCAVMCALWSWPGKAWKGLPPKALICSKLGSIGAIGAGGGSTASIFFTPIASYIVRYTWYMLCACGFALAICNCVWAKVILWLIENIFGSATGMTSTLSSKSACLIFLAPPTTSYGYSGGKYCDTTFARSLNSFFIAA